jgi:hypothetical protein
VDLDSGTLFTLHGRITTAVLALLGSVQVFRWVGRRKLGMAYGLVWLAICSALLAVSVFPALLVGLGRLAGSREPEGALRLAGFVFVAVVLLYLSLKVSALEAKLEALVQALALHQPPASGQGEKAAPRSSNLSIPAPPSSPEP